VPLGSTPTAIPTSTAALTPGGRRSPGGAQVGAERVPDIGGQRYSPSAGRLAVQDDPPGALVEVVQLQPRRLDRSQAQACDQYEDRVVAGTRGIADVAAVEQALHVVRSDRLRDTGVVTLGRRDRPRSCPGASCSATSRRRQRTPLQSEPTANDQPKPIGTPSRQSNQG
jgi:hypothetical protein